MIVYNKEESHSICSAINKSLYVVLPRNLVNLSQFDDRKVFAVGEYEFGWPSRFLFMPTSQ